MNTLLPVLAMLAATVPGAPTSVGLSYTATSTIVTAGDPSLPIYAAPSGVGYDGVAGLLITKSDGTYLCTGSLVGDDHQHIVTAAHCVTGATSIDAVFFPPVGPTIIKTTTTYSIKPGYTGAVIDENDLAMIDLGLAGRVDEVQSYSLFTGVALGEVFNEVGFGLSGTGATGITLPAGLRRQGYNRFDFNGNDPIWDDPTYGPLFGNQDILFADFDNGLAAQDASCNLASFFTASYAAYCDLGLGEDEVLAAPGDSGGPLFIGGRLAAVSSFGITFSGGIVGDVDGVLNSSFGELAGFTPIASNIDWLRSEIVPEPGTWLLLATGLIGIGGAGLVRRRRLELEVE
jgi:hypothetical protein